MARAFQSTRPMRGATSIVCPSSLIGVVSIHAPHAGRDDNRRYSVFPALCFNPRAPCGARPVTMPIRSRTRGFNPRAPCGARLACDMMGESPLQVSIHAPHAGRDPSGYTYASSGFRFNPRAPCGARLITMLIDVLSPDVSIHAPHAGRDTN